MTSGRPPLHDQVQATYWFLRVLLGAGIALVGLQELTSAGPSVVHEQLPLPGSALVVLATLELGAGLAVLFGPVRPASALAATVFALISVALLGAGAELALHTVLVAIFALSLNGLDRVRAGWRSTSRGERLATRPGPTVRA